MIPTRKVGGFIIPQRTMTQMFFSAINGGFSLLSERGRTGFLDSLEKGIIQEGVLSQATAGPMMMLSLFHELQNPLFEKHRFDPRQFLDGLGPALENFHNVSSALENELHKINSKALSSSKPETDEQKSEDIEDADQEVEAGGMTKEDKDQLLLALKVMAKSEDAHAKQKKAAEAILDYEWMSEAKSNPDSLAGQLSRMVTKELFQINQLSSKTAFLLQNQSRNIFFREGSCRVNNVALLSARACLFREKDSEEGAKEYEAIDESLENDFDESEAQVAAQLEVLYDVTQEFVVKEPGNTSLSISDDEESTQTTVVSVATLEGWLHGGPDDGELRWKLTSYRPPYEFPGIEHAYKY